MATSVPKPGDVTRAERFTREAFVHAGETVEDALGPGTARRRALDAALLELDAGAKVPSPDWRRRYSLMLGLERVLSDDEPKLADGTALNPHQVDALSGTLTALLAEAQRNGHEPLAAAAPVLALDDEPEEYVEEPVAADVEDEDEDDDDEPEDLTPLDIEIDIGDDEDEAEEDEPDDDAPEGPLDDDQLDEAPDDPNAHKRFWFEHATGAGKTVAAMGFVDASRTGGILILTHRRNLVDQFHGELRDRGYAKRITPALLQGQDSAAGPVTVETYQWFVRNAGKISEAYSIVICDEAHTALGEKTSGAIRAWTGPIFIGMTATGALIARHVTDLFPTQTSRFDLAQAARRGVIAPLRCVRIPPGPGVRTIAKVPLRRGEVDTEFDQEMLAELLDQGPFNFAAADLYKTRFNGVPGVVYAAGVKHAYNLAEAFREQGVKAQAVSGETRKRELAEVLARYERGDIDVLINAQLLAEGWNSPRATVCMHLAPTASKRIYQQRVGRVTRRNPGKEAGIVVDFVAPDTKNDDPVVTLHSLLDRDVYRGGAIVVGPVRRGRGRRLRVERRVLPVTSDEDRRIEVFERELWRIAVEHLPYGEQIQWAALAGARVAPSGWRRARAMLHFDREGAIKRAFLLTAVQRNKNPQLRVRALQEIAASRDGEAFDLAIDEIGGWAREERREGTKVMLLALAEKRIGRRDQANAWIWRLASYTREVHEEYAVQRWPETKRLLGLLVNSSGAAHARNARRLVHAARKQDRRLSAALLAAAIAHTPEGEEILRGARTRLARKPSALSRELLRNFPKSRGRRGSRRRRKKGAGDALPAQVAGEGVVLAEAADAGVESGAPVDESPAAGTPEAGAEPAPRRSRRSRSRNDRAARLAAAAAAEAAPDGADVSSDSDAPPSAADDAGVAEAIADVAAALAAAQGGREPGPARAAPGGEQAQATARQRRSRAEKPVDDAARVAAPGAVDGPASAAVDASQLAVEPPGASTADGAPVVAASAGAAAADDAATSSGTGDGSAKPGRRRSTAKDAPAGEAPAAPRARTGRAGASAAEAKPAGRTAATATDTEPAAATPRTRRTAPKATDPDAAPAKPRTRRTAAQATDTDAAPGKPRTPRTAAKATATEPAPATPRARRTAPKATDAQAAAGTQREGPAGGTTGTRRGSAGSKPSATPEAGAAAQPQAGAATPPRRSSAATAAKPPARRDDATGEAKPRARRVAAKAADAGAAKPKSRARRAAKASDPTPVDSEIEAA